MSEDNPRYEALRYPGRPFDFSHPDRLAAVGRLSGLETPEVETARILELCCGAGWNALGMAWQLPNARVVAVDACGPPMDDARAAAAALSADNIEFVAADLESMETGERFDYIVAHGALSWVPDPAKRALMKVVGACLADDGLAMVSFNALPGWRFRRMAREMVHAVLGGPPTIDRLPEARAAVKVFADNLVGEGIYGEFVAELFGYVSDCDDVGLYHDLLSPSCDALDFRSFADLYRPVGLQYVAEAEWTDPSYAGYPPEFLALLEPVMNDAVAREQLVDLMVNTLFRRAILCREGRPLKRVPTYERMAPLHVAMTGLYVGEGEEGAEYATGDKEPLVVTDTDAAARLKALWDATPPAITVAELATRVGAETDEAKDRLVQLLLQSWSVELVALLPRPRPHTTAAGARPLSFGPARWRASRGDTRVVNSAHEDLELTREERALVAACDGTKSRAELEETVDGPLDDALDRLAELGLLEIAARRGVEG